MGMTVGLQTVMIFVIIKELFQSAFNEIIIIFSAICFRRIYIYIQTTETITKNACCFVWVSNFTSYSEGRK